MNKTFKNALILSVAFIAWTLIVLIVDVKPIGPQGSEVGMAALNGWFHELTGVHMGLYNLTDIMELAAIAICAGFGVLGAYQWLTRKKLLKVDRDIIVLGVFYIVVMSAYAFFQIVALNYRPVLIEGKLEASYPSSTTLLVVSVMITAIMQCTSRVKGLRRGVLNCIMMAFALFMVIGRAVSGVHWITDIIGSVVLSLALIMWYAYAVDRFAPKKNEKENKQHER